MVYYLKYRPQSLAELIGQTQVKESLENSFKAGKLAHAYLLVGPKGTGKTSTARILAKMVNCEDSKNIPCNKCSTCLSITDGSNLDLIEIDAASNRGIDDVRELREKVKLSPTSSKKKVYIIDEVHMLTQEAFNALLKTLEEPPEHVLFILATTEVHKLPETVLSRVTRLNFKHGSADDLSKALKNVSKKEKLAIDDDALLAIAKKSEGSFRDGLKVLEQLAVKDEKITLKMVEEYLNTPNWEEDLKLLEAISQKNSKQALLLIQTQAELGINLKEYTLSLMDILREMLLIKHGVESKEELGSDKYPKILDLSQKFSSAQIIATLKNLQESLEMLKTASIQSLPLEIAIVESSQGQEESVVSNPQTIVEENKEVSVQTEDNTPRVDTPDLLTLKDKWNYILETVKPYNYSLEALLRQVTLRSCDNGKLTLEVPYSFHQRILEAPKSRNLLESVLAEVLGKPIQVFCVLGKRPVRVEEIANVEVAADDDIIRIASEIFNSESVN